MTYSRLLAKLKRLKMTHKGRRHSVVLRLNPEEQAKLNHLSKVLRLDDKQTARQCINVAFDLYKQALAKAAEAKAKGEPLPTEEEDNYEVGTYEDLEKKEATT
jgi:hypothetical protein